MRFVAPDLGEAVDDGRIDPERLEVYLQQTVGHRAAVIAAAVAITVPVALGVALDVLGEALGALLDELAALDDAGLLDDAVLHGSPVLRDDAGPLDDARPLDDAGGEALTSAPAPASGWGRERSPGIAAPPPWR